jgi:hypothetical protein
VFVTPWHPCLAGKGVAELAKVVPLWDYLLGDKAAVEAEYAHVAQRYAGAEEGMWKREVADEVMRDAGEDWWMAHYDEGSVLARPFLVILRNQNSNRNSHLWRPMLRRWRVTHAPVYWEAARRPHACAWRLAFNCPEMICPSRRCWGCASVWSRSLQRIRVLR